MKEVSLLFSRPKKDNLISKLIRWALKTPYSHVAVEILIDSLNENIVYEAALSGIICMSKKQWEKKNITVYEREFRYPEAEYKKIQKYCIKQLGKPYGFRNLWAIIRRNQDVRDGNESFICSELAYVVLKNKLKIFKDQDHITPKDLYNAIKK